MDREKQIIEINKLCEKYDKKDYPGIAIGVVENGELIFSKGYGEANVEYNIPINENTVFHVCSMAKQFTAACIALLIEDGKLSLEQDVRDFFPQLKAWKERITVGHLLYMTNGIPDVYNTANFVCGIREDEEITLDAFWRYVIACDWCFFKPGEQWSYGNTGYFLLGQIVEAVTKTSLSQYADEHIFKPLGMTQTFFRDDRTKIIKNRAAGYSDFDHLHFNHSYKRYSSQNDTLSINVENVEVGGAGQLWTTLKDLLLWDKNFHHNLLGKGTKALPEFLMTSGMLNSGEECGYGCGLFIQDFHGYQRVSHGGWAGGYSAYYAQLPEMKASVIVLGNHTNFYAEYVEPTNGLVPNILKLLIGDETRAKKTIGPVDVGVGVDTIQHYDTLDITGEYIDEVSCRIWNISKDADGSLIEDSVEGTIRLLYDGAGRFISADHRNTYRVIERDQQIEVIEIDDGHNRIGFYAFHRKELPDSQLTKYEGSYCCDRLGVTFEVKVKKGKLYIKNENLTHTALDLHYTHAVGETFINDYNSYIGNYCITFHRDCNDEVVSFSYRDDAQTFRERFEFVKK